jgi:hypothetical protein
MQRLKGRIPEDAKMRLQLPKIGWSVHGNSWIVSHTLFLYSALCLQWTITFQILTFLYNNLYLHSIGHHIVIFPYRKFWQIRLLRKRVTYVSSVYVSDISLTFLVTDYDGWNNMLQLEDRHSSGNIFLSSNKGLYRTWCPVSFQLRLYPCVASFPLQVLM